MVLQGPTILAGSSMSQCLAFAYHMYGSTMGKLELVQVTANGARNTLFSIEGLNLNEWQIDTIDLPLQNVDYKVSMYCL